jgi:CheY-like chemotaxis protein
MSLVGSLEDLSLLDILQIVNVSRRTGVLRLSPPQLGQAHVYFSTGNVSDIVGNFDELAFLRFFEAQGLVEPSEVREALERTGNKPLQALQKLIQMGALTRPFVEQARRLELSRRLKTLSHCDRGEFLFSLSEDGDVPDESTPMPFCPLETPVSPQNLLTQTMTEASFEATAPRPAAPVPQRPAPAAAATVSAHVTPPHRPKAPEPPPAPAPPVKEPEILTAEVVEVLLPPPKAAAQRPVRPTAPPPPPQAPVPAAEPRSAPAPAPIHMDQSKSKVTVVLAADESIFKSMLRSRLHRHFAQILPVTDLTEYNTVCSELLEQRLPFLALTDLLMPTSDGVGYLGGLELLEKSQLAFPQVKVVLMSDLDDERIVEMARLKGAVEVLMKPALHQIRVDQLEASIDGFAEGFCKQVDRLLPPVEEEVATFYKDLGVEAVGDGYRVRDQLSLLKGLMGELSSPRESSEISLLVLRLAAEYFERAVLFLVKKDEIMGLGGFGETGDPEMMMQKVRRLRIPAGVGSLFDEAVEARGTTIKLLEEFSEIDKDFSQALGAKRAREVVAIPMISRSRVVALLYADNAISGDPLPDLSGIEIFMAQAGLAMEKALLERQLMHLKRSIPNQLGGGKED